MIFKKPLISLRYLRRWNKFLHFFLGGGCLEKESSSKSFPTPARPFIAVKTPVYFFQKENTLLHQRRRSRAANIEAYSLTLFFCSVLYNNVHHHKLHINYISILLYTYLLLSKLYGILNSKIFCRNWDYGVQTNIKKIKKNVLWHFL